MSLLTTGPLLMTALVLLAVIFIFVGRQRRSRTFTAQLMPSAEATRLILGSLVLRGALFRRQVLQHEKNPFRARAPDYGIDADLIIAVARALERSERLLQWIIVVLVLLTIFVAGMLFKFIGVILIFSLTGWMMLQNRFHVSRRFRREHYNEAAIRRDFHVKSEEAGFPGVPVICSGLTNPFIGMGTLIDTWNLTFDTSRPVHGREGHPASVPCALLEQRIEQSVKNLGIKNAIVSDGLFVSGVETVNIPGFHPDRYARPPSSVPSQVAATFHSVSDPRARSYKIVRIDDWGGELVVNYLFRCVKRGAVLTVEAAALAIPPIDDKYREIDRLELLTFWGLVKWSIGLLAGIPLQIVGAGVSVVGQITDFVDALLGGEEGRERKAVRTNPAYNFGALWSLREHTSARNFSAWFQKVDVQQYIRAINEAIMNAIRDELDKAGVDTSSIAVQMISIQNNSMIMSAGGDLSVTGVAMGSGNTASVISQAMANRAA